MAEVEKRTQQPAFSTDAIRAQLEKILATGKFAQSESLSRFLRFTVEQTLQGQGDRLKEYVVACEVFRRAESFDPRLDPIVRVQAGKIRARLQAYYETEGRGDPILIQLPKGGYVPVFLSGGAAEPAAAADPQSVAPAWQRWARAGLVALLLIAAGFGMARWFPIGQRPVNGRLLTRLTSESGASGFPAISRDGRYLAFASDRERTGFDLWVQPLVGGEPSRLTWDEARERQLDISPDGATIVFRSERDGGGIYQVPLLGGPEVRIAEGGYNPRFSPDGHWIVHTGSGYKIYIRPVGGGPPRVFDLGFARVLFPIWTPDAKYVMFLGSRQELGPGRQDFEWWLMPVNGGPVVPTGVSAALEAQGLPPLSVTSAPSDWLGYAVVFSLKIEDNANIWRVPLSPRNWHAAGVAERLTFGPGEQTFPRVAASGAHAARLVFTSDNTVANIWCLPIEANHAKPLGDFEQWTTDVSMVPNEATRQGLSADGRKLVFCSRKAGNADIWMKETATGRETRLTAGPGAEDEPLINPEGSKIAYLSREAKGSVVYIVDTVGGVASNDGRCDRLLDWSRDGNWIACSNGAPASLLNLATGQRLELGGLKYAVREASFSPDQRWIAIVAQERGRGTWRALLAKFRDGRVPREDEWFPATLLPFLDTISRLEWSPDGNLLYFLSTQDSFRCIWAQRLDAAGKRPSGPAQHVYAFHGSQRFPSGHASLSLGGNRLAIALTVSNTNIWMADLSR